jgi:hypothetical protein
METKTKNPVLFIVILLLLGSCNEQLNDANHKLVKSLNDTIENDANNELVKSLNDTIEMLKKELKNKSKTIESGLGDKYEGVWVRKNYDRRISSYPMDRIVIKKDGNNYIIKEQDYINKFWETNYTRYYVLVDNKFVNINSSDGKNGYHPSDCYELAKDNTIETYNDVVYGGYLGQVAIYHKIN